MVSLIGSDVLIGSYFYTVTSVANKNRFWDSERPLYVNYVRDDELYCLPVTEFASISIRRDHRLDLLMCVYMMYADCMHIKKKLERSRTFAERVSANIVHYDDITFRSDPDRPRLRFILEFKPGVFGEHILVRGDMSNKTVFVQAYSDIVLDMPGIENVMSVENL
jgi:hypothetical protein